MELNQSETRINVENGKYTFVVDNGNVSILRYGQPWIESIELGSKAIMALLFEHDDLLASKKS